MDSLLFEEIDLKLSATPEDSLPINLNKLTVIIGPNNTGKSTLLNEVYSSIASRSFSPESSVILEKCDPRILSVDDANLLVSQYELSRDFSSLGGEDYFYYGLARCETTTSHSHNDIIQSFSDERSWQKDSRLFANITSLMVKMLDGQSRLSIIDDAPLGDLRDSKSAHPLKNAFLASNLDEINPLIHEAFKKYLAVTNVTNAGSAVAYIVSESPEDVGVNPKLQDKATIEFFSNSEICVEAKTQSDGTKAFLGLLLELFYSSCSILLIDEPEAFLHPTLAYLLGTAVGKCSSSKQIICSTHSVDFLRGCLDSVSGLNLLRLTRDRGGSVHVFEDHQLRKMQNVPLLRTASVMNGLFYNAAVVVEGDSDEAFYREINYRLSDTPGYLALNNTLFVSSHGVDTEYKIVSILRRAGIPTASIVDFDFLGKPDDAFGKLLSSANISGTLYESLKSQKRAVSSAVAIANEEKAGINVLDEGETQAINALINNLSDYGIFVVPNGALESWLNYLNIKATKDEWLRVVFERLGEDPANPSYVRPGKEDVWAFLERIESWIANPERRGMVQSSRK